MSKIRQKSKQPKHKFISCRVPEDLYTRFESEAKKNNRSLSGEFRERIKQAVGQ